MNPLEQDFTNDPGRKIRNSKFEIRNSRLRAFTFIEVMVALAVVSISLLVLLRLHLMSIRMAEKADMTYRAVFLAEEKLAEILGRGFPQEGASSGEVERNGIIFNWRTEVAADSDEGLDLQQLHKEKIFGLRKISVDISCNQGHVQLSTYVTDSSRRPRSGFGLHAPAGSALTSRRDESVP